jgi:hypothetical protein
MSDDSGKKKVVIFTRQFEIKGNLHIYEGVRLTDYINESKSFIAVTDVEVKRQTGEVVMESSFLDVSVDDIEIIIPEDAIISKPA